METVGLQGPWIAYVDKITNCDEKEMNKAIGGHAEINVRVSHWNPLRPLELQTLNGYLRLVNSTIDDDHWVRRVVDVCVERGRMSLGPPTKTYLLSCNSAAKICLCWWNPCMLHVPVTV